MARGQRGGWGGDAMWLWGAEALAQEHHRRLLPPALLPNTPSSALLSKPFASCLSAGGAGLVPVGKQCPYPISGSAPQCGHCQEAQGSLQLRPSLEQPNSPQHHQSHPSAAPPRLEG